MKSLTLLRKTAEKIVEYSQTLNGIIFESFHLYNEKDNERVDLFFSFVYWGEMDKFVNQLQTNHLGDLIVKKGMHSLQVVVTEPRGCYPITCG
jgi:hypothetical protein